MNLTNCGLKIRKISIIFLSLLLYTKVSLSQDSDETLLNDPFATEEQSDYTPYDPFEGFNRRIFWFNNKVDYYILEPVAEGYRYITPDPVIKGISNIFTNLYYPVNLVSDLLQFKFVRASEDTARFVINSTVGVLGFFDVAKELNLEQNNDDIGIALASYGIGEGPYLVLPILGPSNLRDFVGGIGDRLVHPQMYPNYINSTSTGQRTWISGSLGTGEVISVRERLIETINSAKEASTDYYSFTQASFHQIREKRIKD